MEKAYMLNDYVASYEQKNKEFSNGTDLLIDYQFRTQNARTIEELKSKVNYFLERNNVPDKLKNELINNINSINSESDLYKTSIYLENIVKNYVLNKENESTNVEEEINNIKTELVEENINNLNKVGIKVEGDIESIKDKIENENDVYKFERNIDNVVSYYDERNKDIPKEDINISSDNLSDALDKPKDDTVVNNVIDNERKNVNTSNSVSINENGNVEIESNKNNSDSMNFIAMMTLLLSTNYSNNNLDIKFIKEQAQTDNFKMTYVNHKSNNQIDSTFENKITEMVNSYNKDTSYMQLLNSRAPELATVLHIIDENVFDKTGSFKMAVKSSGQGHDIKLGMDNNYQEMVDSFFECGAFTTQGINNSVIVMLPSNNDQLVLLNSTLENIRTKKDTKIDTNKLTNQNVKQLIYKNDAAYIPIQLLSVITITCIIEIIGLLYLMLR